MTGGAKNTITKLIFELGCACSAYLDKTLVNLGCQRIQCDEIWSYVGAKQRNVTLEMAEERVCGDVWTWIALDADSKLICAWLVGKRTSECAKEFIQDLASRLRHRVQLTTDGLRLYLTAVLDAFGEDIDYALLHKIYGADLEDDSRYSPAKCVGREQIRVLGGPDPRYVALR